MIESSRTERGGAERIPLVIDVDGTLLKTDLLHESVLQFVAHHPLELWRLPTWLAGGRNRLKCKLASRVSIDVKTLPLRPEIITQVRQAQEQDRPVYLASASEHGLVQRLADEIGGIAGVFGTDLTSNVAGSRKAEKLNAAFGRRAYDYIGDRPIDFSVWESARNVLAVSHSSGFSRRLKRRFPDAQIVSHARVRARDYLKAMRPHQWAKNLLIFLSVVAGHHLDSSTVLATLLAFICFCSAASSAYLINDLLDLPGDREHPRKRLRPFAAGDVPALHGVVLAALLMATALSLASLLPPRFLFVLSVYVVLTLCYSLVLKRRLFIDVIVLGGLYTLRVLGGVTAADDPQSPWLLMFSLFLFLSLAAVKRCSELVARREGGKPAPPGRGYQIGDLQVLFPLAAAAGYGAVLVVTLYLSSPDVTRLYSHPVRMWLICPLLMYWISRVLLISARNELHDDPVIFALTDRVSWATGALVAAVIAMSI